MAVVQNYLQEDSILIDKIVYELKSQGIFDQFRKECIADVDTKPAYQNLRQRVEGSVSGFLSKQKWSPDMNKNQVREMLRKNIYESGFLETGVERIVDQVVNPKINSIFLPKVTEIVYKFFGIATEDKKNEPTVDLLPKDLEAVSPESEKIDDSNLDDSKIDEDESPPFEPLEVQTAYVPPEDNSVDSHMSGFSELVSHDSNVSQVSKPLLMDVSNQDSMASKQSSDDRLSIVMSDENDTKTDTGDDDSKSKRNFENVTEKREKKDDRSRSKSSHDKSSRSRSEKDRRSDKDRKDLKYSSKDRDKSKDSNSRNGKSDNRDKERSKSSHSSSSHRHSSSHRSKESSSKDRSKDKSSRDSKSKDEKRKSHHSESKSSKRDSHSSKSSSSRSRDSKKDTKSKDKDAALDNCKKRSDRRSTDRDSNDGQSGLKSSSGSFDSLTSSQVSQQGKGQESNSNSNGDSGNSDAQEEMTTVTILEEINEEITITPQAVRMMKPRFAANFQEAKRLMKIRRKMSEIEKENKVLGVSMKKEEVKKVVADVPESPPLRSVAVSAASWEALEAKLNESVANEQYYKQSYYDSPDTPEKDEVAAKVSTQVSDECHYFERESCSKTERYIKFVSDLVGKLEKDIKKVDHHSASPAEPAVDSSTSKEELSTGVKRKLIDTNAVIRQSNKRFNIEVHENFPLPLSPAESDNSVDRKSDLSESSDRKNDGDVDKAKRNLRAPAKKQRYSSDDLYKPRPLFSGSRRRAGRNVGGVD